MRMRRDSDEKEVPWMKISFVVPDQPCIDRGELPYFSLDLYDLASDDGLDAFESEEDGLFFADALSVLSNDIHDAADAHIVASWLEHFAMEIREKFATPIEGAIVLTIPGNFSP